MPGQPVQGLEHALLLSLRQRFDVRGAQHMGLRHVSGQDVPLLGLDAELLIPLRQRQPLEQPLVAACGV